MAGLFAFGSLANAAFNSAEFSGELSRTAEGLDISAAELDAWGRAATKLGGSSEALRGSIAGLNQSLFELYLTGNSAIVPALLRLGINFSDLEGNIKKPLDLLPELAGAFERLTKFETTSLGAQLGLDAGTIRLLQSGREEVDKFIEAQKELGVITKEDERVAREFNEQLKDMAQIADTVYRSIATLFLPVITSALDVIEDLFNFFRRNEVFAKGFFTIIGVAAVAAAALVVPAMLSIAASVFAAISPFLLVIAVVGALGVAFGLALDELENFRNGNKSLIGELLSDWPLVSNFLKGTIDLVKFLLDSLIALGKYFITVWVGPREAFNELKSDILSGIDELFKAGRGLSEYWDGLFKGFTTFLKEFKKISLGDFSAFSDEAPSVSNRPEGLEVPIGDSTQQVMQRAKQQIDIINRTPIPPAGVGGRQVRIEVGDINIQTQATDADGIAQSIQPTLESIFTRAQEQLDNGVAR